MVCYSVSRQGICLFIDSLCKLETIFFGLIIALYTLVKAVRSPTKGKCGIICTTANKMGFLFRSEVLKCAHVNTKYNRKCHLE